MRRQYYTLVASLPHLEHFARVQRLPINRERLDRRLADLDADHLEQLTLAENLVEWRRQPHGRGDPEVVAQYETLCARLSEPGLRDFVVFRMELRTVLAGLRRRHAGEPAPREAERWGVAPVSKWVLTHWDEPEFGLTIRYPWLAEARKLLEAGEARALERLLMERIWLRLAHEADGQPFAFEAVYAFVFRWNLVSRWLSRSPPDALQRFRALVSEALDEQPA